MDASTAYRLVSLPTYSTSSSACVVWRCSPVSGTVLGSISTCTVWSREIGVMVGIELPSTSRPCVRNASPSSRPESRGTWCDTSTLFVDTIGVAV